MNYKIDFGKNEKGQYVDISFSIANVYLTLLCGETGTGKSVFHNYLYKKLMEQNSPNEVSFIFMDMTRVDFVSWNNQYMVMPTIVDANKAIETLEKLSTEKIDENKHIFIHIEECDMFALDQKRTENAIQQLKIKRPDIHIIYSTSSPRESVLSDDLISEADLKIVFKVASIYDSNRLLGDDTAFNLKPNGERVVDMKNWRNKIQPFSEEEVKMIIESM